MEEKEKKIKPVPDDMKKRLLAILLPFGYSCHKERYTGASPFINEGVNIITLVFDTDDFPFSIIMDRYEETEDEENCLGFYSGIMKLIAPELISFDEKFNSSANIMDFDWVEVQDQNTPFPVAVTLNT